MGKLLLVAAAAVLVAVWVSGGGHGAGGGGGVFAAAEGSAPVVFGDGVSWRQYYRTAGRSSEEDMRRVRYYLNSPHAGYRRELPATPSVVSTEPPSCLARSNLGGDVCEEDPDYDDSVKRHVLNLLSRDIGVNALLSDPSLRTLLNDPESFTKDTIHTRIGVSESPVCAAQETIIYPKRAKTSREDWVFVLNQEGVQQALRVEKCISNGSSCNIGMGLPGDAKATCRQKYVYRRMLVVGTNKIEPEEVLMPSCCVCYTTYQDLLTRSRNDTRSHTPAVPAAAPSAPAIPPLASPTPFRPMTPNFGRSMGGRAPFIRFPGGR